MFTRLRIILSIDEYKALQTAAKMDVRGEAQQVQYFVREELIRRGLLRELNKVSQDSKVLDADKG